MILAKQQKKYIIQLFTAYRLKMKIKIKTLNINYYSIIFCLSESTFFFLWARAILFCCVLELVQKEKSKKTKLKQTAQLRRWVLLLLLLTDNVGYISQIKLYLHS